MKIRDLLLEGKVCWKAHSVSFLHLNIRMIPLIGEGKSLTDRESFQTIWMDWRRAMRVRIHDNLEQIQSSSCEDNEGHCWMRGKRIPFGWAKIWDLVTPWSGRVTFEIAWKLPEWLKRIQHSIPLGAESVAPMECSRWRLAGDYLERDGFPVTTFSNRMDSAQLWICLQFLWWWTI
jgi:hypothetical protein